MTQEIDHSLLARIADALERMAPRRPAGPDLQGHSAFVWHASPPELEAVARVNRVDLSLLRGIDLTRDILIENTERFAKGLPANSTAQAVQLFQKLYACYMATDASLVEINPLNRDSQGNLIALDQAADLLHGPGRTEAVVQCDEFQPAAVHAPLIVDHPEVGRFHPGHRGVRRGRAAEREALTEADPGVVHPGRVFLLREGVSDAHQARHQKCCQSRSHCPSPFPSRCAAAGLRLRSTARYRRPIAPAMPSFIRNTLATMKPP